MPTALDAPPASAAPAARDEQPVPAPAEADPAGRRPPGGRPKKPWSWPRFWRNAALIAAGVALAVWFGVEHAYPNLVPKNFGVVAEGRLYRSGELTPRATRTVVERHGIRTIIDLGAHDPGSREEEIAQATADALGVTRHRIFLIGDGTGDPNRYAAALRIATDPANQPVLIHCAAGAQRTGCAIALYRHHVEGVAAEDAIAEASGYRHDPEKTPEMPAMFWRWKDEIGRALEDGGPIDFTPEPGVDVDG